MNFQWITPKQAHQALLDKQPCTLIDVREGMEHRHEKPEHAVHTPLSSFDDHVDKLSNEQPIYVLCKSGNRACKAGQELIKHGITNFKIIEGGLDAWKSQGLPTQASPKTLWSLERQVRFTAGLLVTLGIVLSLIVTPNAMYLSLFIGVGFMFSALTNTCGMGMVLTKMPWNHK